MKTNSIRDFLAANNNNNRLPPEHIIEDGDLFFKSVSKLINRAEGSPIPLPCICNDSTRIEFEWTSGDFDLVVVVGFLKPIADDIKSQFRITLWENLRMDQTLAFPIYSDNNDSSKVLNKALVYLKPLLFEKLFPVVVNNNKKYV